MQHIVTLTHHPSLPDPTRPEVRPSTFHTRTQAARLSIAPPSPSSKSSPSSPRIISTFRAITCVSPPGCHSRVPCLGPPFSHTPVPSSQSGVLVGRAARQRACGPANGHGGPSPHGQGRGLRRQGLPRLGCKHTRIHMHKRYIYVIMSICIHI